MRAALLVLTLAALAAGCSRRDRANPLDPSNPTTGGRPANFIAVAGYSVVTLTWAQQPANAIDGYRLERMSPGDTAYRVIGGDLPATAARYVDAGVPNGALERYRLYFLVRGAVTNEPAEDQATPGALRPWVADGGAQQLARLSPDGRHVAFTVTGVGAAQSLAQNPLTGVAWCASADDGFLTQVDVDGTILFQQTGLQAPSEIALGPGDGSAWFCARSTSTQVGAVLHVDASGAPRAPTALSPLDDPMSVAVSPRDFSVWVAEYGGRRVIHYSATGALMGATVLSSPERVLVDSATNVTWVSSNQQGEIWRLAVNGALIDSSSAASGPLGMAIDHAHGRAWVTDPRAGQLLALDPSTLAVVVRVQGLDGVWDVAVDPASGDAWVTVRGQQAVLRFDRDGHLLERCGGFGDPFEIRLDPGTEGAEPGRAASAVRAAARRAR